MTLDRTPPPVEAAATAALSRYLRLPEDFGTDPAAEAALIEALEAAIEAVEARTGRVLAPRRLTARTARWRGERPALPAGPAKALASLTVTDAEGVETGADVAALRVEPGHPPALSGALPTIPCGGEAAIVYDAGYGTAWGDAPADLRLAAITLAAAIWEGQPSAAGAAVDLLTAAHRAARL